MVRGGGEMGGAAKVFEIFLGFFSISNGKIQNFGKH